MSPKPLKQYRLACDYTISPIWHSLAASWYSRVCVQWEIVIKFHYSWMIQLLVYSVLSTGMSTYGGGGWKREGGETEGREVTMGNRGSALSRQSASGESDLISRHLQHRTEYQSDWNTSVHIPVPEPWAVRYLTGHLRIPFFFFEAITHPKNNVIIITIFVSVTLFLHKGTCFTFILYSNYGIIIGRLPEHTLL